MKAKGTAVTARPTVEERLLTSARQALGIKRGQVKASRIDVVPVSTARNTAAAEPPVYSRERIIELRQRFKLSQAVFAQVLGVSPAAEQSWEQGTNPPSGPVRRLLEVIELRPELVQTFVRETRPRTAANEGGQRVQRVSERRPPGSRSGSRGRLAR
jgi:DNA-binding transcriptional regulator YiaG